ncbi:MAG: gamma-glutamyl-gamma-aminobutyrate hydrolase family protein [Acidimicrobiales bacterium]
MTASASTAAAGDDPPRPRIGITTSTGQGTTSLVERAGRGYIEAIVAAGGLPVLLPTVAPELARAAIAAVDGLVLTGGGDVDPAAYGAAPALETEAVDPARDAWEVELVGEARAQRRPILAICRGAQVLNVACGGTLVQHLPHRTDAEHTDWDRAGEEVHAISVAAGSLLRQVLGTDELVANTIHHQAVELPGPDVVVCALADDGVVEGIELPGEAVLGVQWHPELLADRPVHASLFRWVVDAARLVAVGAAHPDPPPS